MRDDILYEYAMKFVGVPYKYGGLHPMEGWDCSQFCLELLQACNYVKHGLDTTALGIYNLLISGGAVVGTAKFGSYAFFGKSYTDISHIGFCLDEHSMIEAGGGDRTTKDLPSAIKRKAFVRIRPIRYRSDFLCTVTPA